MYAKIITTTIENEEGQQEEVKQIETLQELPKIAVVGEYRIFNPSYTDLGYEIITPEEREGYTWELAIVNDKIEVVYTEIPVEPEPTEEEIAEAQRLEAERQEQLRLQAIANRENYFNNNFFETSLGYIRETVNMVDGSTKSFLFDLLPTIVLGVNAGQQVQVIAYNRPDSFENEVDYVSLQHVETVTSQFLLECMQAVNTKFRGE